MKTVFVTLICITMYTLGYAGKVDSTAKIQSAATAAAVGDIAPNFVLKNMQGQPVTLADYKGKIVILDFWATWCGPCKASFPGMQKAVDKFKDNPNVVFLFVDGSERQSNYMAAIRNFLDQTQYTFTVIADGRNEAGEKNRIMKDYGIAGIPTKIVIDKAGYIRFKKVGFNPSMSADELAEEVARMIKEAGKAKPEKIS